MRGRGADFRRAGVALFGTHCFACESERESQRVPDRFDVEAEDGRGERKRKKKGDEERDVVP